MSLQAPHELNLVQNEQARTESYTLRARAPVIGDDLIAWLKAKLAQGEGSTIRVCLHPDTDAALHQMVIVHRPGGVFDAHKHLATDEAYHMIEGRLRITMFDDEGGETQSHLLGAPGCGLPYLLRVRAGTWHRTVPESDHAVFHEARPGPFRRDDSVVAPWEAAS